MVRLRDSLAGGTEAPVRWADPQAGPDVDQGFTFRNGAIALAVVALVGLWVSWSSRSDASLFLAVHALLEAIPSVIAFAMLSIGWESARQRRPSALVMLASGFFGVALLNGFHLLYDPALPNWVTQASIARSASLWLFGGVLAVTTLLMVSVIRWDSPSTLRTRLLWLAGVLSVSCVALLVSVWFPQALSTLVSEGPGHSRFRVVSGLMLVSGALLAGFLFWRRVRDTGTGEMARLAVACWTLAVAEVFFLGTPAAEDLLHLLGHVYKCAAFWLVYTAVIHLGIREPWERVQVSERKLDSLVREKTAILDNVTMGVCFVRDGRFVLVNRAFEGMFGYTNSELRGRATNAPTGHLPRFAAEGDEVNALFGVDQAFRSKLELHHRDGRPLRVRVCGRALTSGVPEAGSIWCFEDETERLDSSEKLVQALLETSRHAEALEEINRLNEWLLACRLESEAWPLIAKSGARLFSARGYLAIQRDDLGQLEVVAPWGDWGTSVPAAFAVEACWGLRRGQAHELFPSDTRLQCSHVEPLPPAGCLCLPLSVHGRDLGLLFLEHPGDPAGLQAGWRRLVETFAATIKSTISNLRLRNRLQEQATRDSLTGLLNRRSLDEALPRELHRARRSGEPISVAMIDADHFKAINDNHGHEAGDAVLRRLGQLLRDNLRISDISCRFGGEEFVVVMPGTTAAQAQMRLDTLRRAIGEYDFQHVGQPLGHLSVSIGVAQWPEHGDTHEALLREADRALYQAKQAGRNCCLVVSPGQGAREANDSTRG